MFWWLCRTSWCLLLCSLHKFFSFNIDSYSSRCSTVCWAVFNQDPTHLINPHSWSRPSFQSDLVKSNCWWHIQWSLCMLIKLHQKESKDQSSNVKVMQDWTQSKVRSTCLIHEHTWIPSSKLIETYNTHLCFRSDQGRNVFNLPFKVFLNCLKSLFWFVIASL